MAMGTRTGKLATVSLSEFSRFEEGSRWILQVNAFDTVVSVEPDR
jgi:hypothetical protein